MTIVLPEGVVAGSTDASLENTEKGAVPLATVSVAGTPE
jgi:hypothetical protein